MLTTPQVDIRAFPQTGTSTMDRPRGLDGEFAIDDG